MTRIKKRFDPKVIPGKVTPSSKGGGNFRDANYYKDRSAKMKGRIFPTFSHSKVDQIITTFSDPNYLTIQARILGESSGYTYFQNFAKLVVTEGRTVGNMKDKDDTQETNYSLICVHAITAILDLAYSLAFRELTSGAFTENDATSSTTYPSHMTQSNFDILLGVMEDKGLLVPNWVLALARSLMLIIRTQDAYENGKTTFPPRYLLPILPNFTLAVLIGKVDAWAAANLSGRTHMDKYGVKYSTFSRSMIADMPEKDVNSPEAIAYFANAPLAMYYDGAEQVYKPSALAMDGAAWTTYKLWFPRDEAGPNIPGTEGWNAFCWLFHAYHATYNPYGGLLASTRITETADRCGFMQVAHDGTVCTVGDFADFYDIPMYYWALWCQTDIINVSYTGTHMTAADDDIARWPLAITNGYIYGTGLPKEVIIGAAKTFAMQNL